MSQVKHCTHTDLRYLQIYTSVATPTDKKNHIFYNVAFLFSSYLTDCNYKKFLLTVYLTRERSAC